MKPANISFSVIFLLVFSIACQNDFLDVNRDKRQVIPETIADFQAMLDHTNVMNNRSSHELGVVGSDAISLLDASWNSLVSPYQKNGYIWADNVYEGETVNDWDQAYYRILLANTALEGVEGIEPGAEELQQWENVKGSALFFRTWNFYQLAQLFCGPYNEQTAATDPGIPLRLVSDITAKSTRASIEATYGQMIRDLKEAAELLPETPSVFYRPSKPAAFALLSRIFLQMGNYDEAARYADSCIRLKDGLLDLNDLDLTIKYPFPAFGEGNPEVIFMTRMQNILIVASARQNIDSGLLRMYEEGDLRRQAYFNATTEDQRTLFTGSYDGRDVLFTGLSTSEVLLTRAECFARQGETVRALNDMNRLLKHRYKTERFVPAVALKPEELLAFVIKERRKELILRGTRWEDLRRLNKEPEFAEVLVREVNDKRYELIPGDLRYVWPIPDNVIELSGMEQNSR